MRAAGESFEQRACDELERAGLRLLTRNYTTRHGELDLVMREGDTVVFVEVRYRKSASHGDAAASVTTSKQGKLIQGRATLAGRASATRTARLPLRRSDLRWPGRQHPPALAAGRFRSALKRPAP